MILRTLSLFLFCFFVTTASAMPAFLMTHNHTDLESNAYIDGVIPSIYPTKAHSDSKIYWNMVKLACYGHVRNNLCLALIKIGTEVPERAVDIGYVTLNLLTGEITPAVVSGNGFTLVVNGPGETTITQS